MGRQGMNKNIIQLKLPIDPKKTYISNSGLVTIKISTNTNRLLERQKNFVGPHPIFEIKYSDGTTILIKEDGTFGNVWSVYDLLQEFVEEESNNMDIPELVEQLYNAALDWQNSTSSKANTRFRYAIKEILDGYTFAASGSAPLIEGSYDGILGECRESLKNELGIEENWFGDCIKKVITRVHDLERQIGEYEEQKRLHDESKTDHKVACEGEALQPIKVDKFDKIYEPNERIISIPADYQEKNDQVIRMKALELAVKYDIVQYNKIDMCFPRADLKKLADNYFNYIKTGELDKS